MKNKDLAAALQQWFNDNLTRQNKWSDNEVGILIKETLNSIGNWKNAPRGNPSKGLKIKRENQFKKEHGPIDEL